MVFTTVGKGKVATMIAADVYEITVGDDGTASSVSDTDLVSELTGSEKTPSTNITNNRVTVTTTYNALDLEDETIAEIAVKNEDDLLYDRIVIPDFDKTDANTLTIIDVIRVA